MLQNESLQAQEEDTFLINKTDEEERIDSKGETYKILGIAVKRGTTCCNLFAIFFI